MECGATVRQWDCLWEPVALAQPFRLATLRASEHHMQLWYDRRHLHCTHSQKLNTIFMSIRGRSVALLFKPAVRRNKAQNFDDTDLSQAPLHYRLYISLLNVPL